MPIGRNVRIKWGAEDGARRASMLNTPKNARRNMTHLAKALKFGIRGRLPIRNIYKSRLQ